MATPAGPGSGGGLPGRQMVQALGSAHAVVERFRSTETYRRFKQEDIAQGGRLRGNREMVPREIFQSLMEEFGFIQSKPEVVSEAEFDDLAATSKHPVLYRGVRESEGGHQQFQEFLTGDHFLGRGIQGDGTYTTTDAQEAARYARKRDRGSGSIIKMALKPDANVIDIKWIEELSMSREKPSLFKKMFKAAYDAYDRGDEDRALKLEKLHDKMWRKWNIDNQALRNDSSNWALMVDADAVKGFGGVYIILNREALWVQDKPYQYKPGD